MADDKPDTTDDDDDDQPQVRFRSSADMGSRVNEWFKKDKGRSFMQGAQDYYDSVGGGFAQFARSGTAPPPQSRFIVNTDSEPAPEPEAPKGPVNVGEITHRPLRATSDVDAEIVDAEIVEG